MQNAKLYSVKYSLYEYNKVLLRSFSGKVTMHDIIDVWRNDIEKGMVNKNLFAVVSDFSNCDNQATMKDLKNIAAFYREHDELLKDMKIAVVINSPNISIPLYYETGETVGIHKSFSTQKAAIAWAKEK